MKSESLNKLKEKHIIDLRRYITFLNVFSGFFILCFLFDVLICIANVVVGRYLYANITASFALLNAIALYIFLGFKKEARRMIQKAQDKSERS